MVSLKGKLTTDKKNRQPKADGVTALRQAISDHVNTSFLPYNVSQSELPKLNKSQLAVLKVLFARQDYCRDHKLDIFNLPTDFKWPDKQTIAVLIEPLCMASTEAAGTFYTLLVKTGLLPFTDLEVSGSSGSIFSLFSHALMGGNTDVLEIFPKLLEGNFFKKEYDATRTVKAGTGRSRVSEFKAAAEIFISKNYVRFKPIIDMNVLRAIVDDTMQWTSRSFYKTPPHRSRFVICTDLMESRAALFNLDKYTAHEQLNIIMASATIIGPAGRNPVMIKNEKGEVKPYADALFAGSTTMADMAAKLGATMVISAYSDRANEKRMFDPVAQAILNSFLAGFNPKLPETMAGVFQKGQSIAQTIKDKGYFIDDSGRKIAACLLGPDPENTIKPLESDGHKHAAAFARGFKRGVGVQHVASEAYLLMRAKAHRLKKTTAVTTTESAPSPEKTKLEWAWAAAKQIGHRAYGKAARVARRAREYFRPSHEAAPA